MKPQSLLLVYVATLLIAASMIPAATGDDCDTIGVALGTPAPATFCDGGVCMLNFNVQGLPPGVAAFAFQEPVMDGEGAWGADPSTDGSGGASFTGNNGGNAPSSGGTVTVVWGPPAGSCTGLSVPSPGCVPGC